MFGGFALRAKSLGHLEQIDSYAPGHQVRFGSLNYVADIRGDLVFAGYETATTAPGHLDGHGLNLSSDRIQEIAPVTTPALDTEHIAASKDWRFNPATEATDSPALEPNTEATSYEEGILGPSDSSPATGSEPRASVPIESDWAPVMEFTPRIFFSTHPWVTC